MKKIIVVGANGFLGRNLTKYLSEKNLIVCALVAKGTDYAFLLNLPNVSCLEFELDDIDQVEELITEEYDVLYNLAWVGVSTTFKNEALLQAQNVLYGLKVMEFANHLHISKVVCTGSASEFSCSNEVINGNNIPAPSDLYSASKVATHYLCDTYARQNNLELIWTSISSVYGPGRNDNNLITYSIKSFLNKVRPQFTKLEQKWDYIYIEDLIKALYLLGKKGIGGKVYPIGSGDYRQMVEYVNIIKNSIDSTLPMGIGELPYKNKTIDNQIIDISSLTNDTGFKPDYSFEAGIQKTIDYYKSIL